MMFDAHTKYVLDHTPLYSETINDITYQICRYDKDFYTEYYIDDTGKHSCGKETFNLAILWLGSCIIHDKKSTLEKEVFPTEETIMKYMNPKIKGIQEFEDKLLDELGIVRTDLVKEDKPVGWG